METDDSTTTSGNPVKQFSVMLENRIGALHSMINLLGSGGVYALGFSVQDSFDVTILRLVVSDPEQLETFFMERGISHTVNDIVVVELKTGEDALEKTLRALSHAETNIYVSYPLLVHPRDHSVLAIRDRYFSLVLTGWHAVGLRVGSRRQSAALYHAIKRRAGAAHQLWPRQKG